MRVASTSNFCQSYANSMMTASTRSVSPALQQTLDTSPPFSALRTFCIFMASTIARGWPSSILSPSLTDRDTTCHQKRRRMPRGTRRHVAFGRARYKGEGAGASAIRVMQPYGDAGTTRCWFSKNSVASQSLVGKLSYIKLYRTKYFVFTVLLCSTGNK